MSETTAPVGKRRPKDEDLDTVLYSIASGASLKATCEEMGLDTPSAHRWLETDDDRRQSYARAREISPKFQEQALRWGWPRPSAARSRSGKGCGKSMLAALARPEAEGLELLGEQQRRRR